VRHWRAARRPHQRRLPRPLCHDPGRLLQRPGGEVAVLPDRSGEGSWEGDAQMLSMLCLLSAHHLSLPTLVVSALFLLYSLVPFTPLAARCLTSPWNRSVRRCWADCGQSSSQLRWPCCAPASPHGTTLPPARVPGPSNFVLIIESVHHVLNVVFFEKHSPNFAQISPLFLQNQKRKIGEIEGVSLLI
jgi:hypothetical protein